MNRHFGIEVLGKYGYAQGLSKLREVIYNENEYKNLRIDAIQALGQIRAPEAITELLQVYEKYHDKDLQNAALMGIRNVSNDKVVFELYKALQNGDGYIRTSVVMSLGLIGDVNSIPYLATLVNDPNSDVRWAVAEALGKIGNYNGVELLKILCKDSEAEVRTMAVRSPDMFFPDLSRNFFIDLANDVNYPERKKVIEILGQYRFSNVRDVLLGLCADVDPIQVNLSFLTERPAA